MSIKHAAQLSTIFTRLYTTMKLQDHIAIRNAVLEFEYAQQHEGTREQIDAEMRVQSVVQEAINKMQHDQIVAIDSLVK